MLWCLIALSAWPAGAQKDVTSAADPGVANDGQCTLREALLGGGGSDCPGSGAVHFNIPGTGPHVIQLTGQFVAVSPIEVDGSTQPGAEDVCTLPIPDRPAYQIILDGGGTVSGAFFAGSSLASGSIIRGLNLRNFTDSAIDFRMSDDVTVQCNFIGTDETGTVAMGNGEYGAVFTENTTGITVGGPDPGDGNLISGNTNGVQFGGPRDSFIQRNFIGTDKTGTLPIPNRDNGITLRSGSSDNTVGGTAARSANIVAFNGGRGITLVNSNISGSTPLGNRILRNSFFENRSLGIDLNSNGVTANDGNDADFGANRLMNFPVLTAASLSGSTLSVTYRVTSTTSNQTYPLRVEFFYADVDGQEGQTYLGFQNYTSANQTRTANLPAGSLGSRVVATATDADGNTSEFSASQEIANLPVDLSITKTDGVTTATPGGSLTYTLVASSQGPGDGAGAVVSDTLPSGLSCTYTSTAADGASGNDSGSGDINDTVNLPPGSSITYTVNCLIDPAATGTLSNTATVTAASTDNRPGNNSARDTTRLVPSADVSVSISGPGTTLVAGGSAIYTLTAANAGPSRDPRVRIRNTPPSDLSCSWTSSAAGGASGNGSGSGNLNQFLDLPVGASVTYTMSCSVDVGTTGDVTNTASVTPSVSDPDSGNNTDSTTNASGTAGLTVEKTGPTTVVPGDTIQYTAAVTNTGTLDLASVTFTDVMPSQLEGCSFVAAVTGPLAFGFTPSGTGDITDTGIFLAPNTRLAYTVTCTVRAAASGTIRNTASATWGGGTEPDTSDNSASVDTRINRFDLVVFVGGPGDLDPGDSEAFTLTLVNNSNVLTNPVSFSHTPSSDLEGCSHTATATGATGFSGTGTGTISDTGIVMAPSGQIQYTVRCNVRLDAVGPIVTTASATLVGKTEVDLTNNTDTLSTSINNDVNLVISKQDDSDLVPVGGTLTYTVEVTNAGGVWDAAALVEDPVPTGLEGCTWTSVASGGAIGNGSGTGDLTDTIGLPPSGRVIYTFACVVRADAPDTLVNTATVTASRNDVNTGNNTAVITTPVRRVADLQVTKTNGVDSLTAGEPTTWTITVLNDGPSANPSVAVTDTFPASVENCAWTSTASAGASGNTPSGTGNLSETLSLDAGAQVTYTATCDVPASATGTVTNSARASGAGVFDDDGSNNLATDGDPITGAADISVTKTNGATVSTAGGSTTYTVVAANAGPSDDTGVAVVDTPPSALSCTWTSAAAGGASGSAGSGSGNLAETLSLPAGASVTYTLVCDIDAAATGSLSNTGTVTGSFDANAANDAATDTDTLASSADISVTKTNGTTESTPGTSTTYTVVAANAGPSDDAGVAVDDTPPSTLSCTWTSAAAGGASGSAGSGSGSLSETLSLPAGAAVTYTLVCDIDPAATGSLVNTATVTGSFDANAANDSATDTDTLQPSSDIAVAMTNGTAVSTPGGTTTYTIDVSNVGRSDDPSATLTDTPPPTLTCTYSSVASGGATGNTASGAGGLAETLSLPAGARVTYTLVCDIDPAAAGSLSNTATVTGSFDDGTGKGRNSATDTDTLEGSADVSVTKTNGTDDSTPGTATTYTVVASNAGPSADTGVAIADTLPSALSCTWTSTAAGGATGSAGSGSGSLAETLSLPPGASVAYTLTCNIDAAATGSLTNTATVTGSFDGNAANNAATDTDTLSRSADVSVSKTNGGTDSVPGASTTYTVVVSNAGPSDDGSVDVLDTLPSALSCIWNSSAAGGATGSAGSGSGSLAETLSLPAGASVTYRLICDIDPAATGSLTNTATVTGSFDGNAANDSATDTDNLQPRSDIAVGKSNGTTVSTPGGTTTYTIDVVSGGFSDDPSVTLTDTLPPELTCTYSSVASGGATGNTPSGTGSLAETLSLPTGSLVTYTLVCNIDSAASGSLTNTATVTGTFDNGTGDGPNVSTDTDTLEGSADISVTKTNGTDDSTPGTSTTYTVVAANAGPSDDAGVSIVDALPSDLSCTWTSVAAGGATGSAGAGSGDLAETLSLPAGASMTYTLVCDIDSAANGSLTNTATVTGSYDDNAANNGATDTDTLSRSADVSVSKTNGGTDSVPGTSTTYTVVAANAGPSNDAGVSIVDNLPSELTCTWTSAASGGATGSAGSGSGNLAETLSLPAGASVTYTLVCDIDSAATGSLTNTATVTGSYDDNAANDSATDTDTLSGSADVAVSKTNGGTDSVPGTSTTYTVVASNAGPSDDAGVSIVDDLPSELTCTWTSTASGGASGSAGAGSGNLAETLSLPAGASVTYTLACDIDSAATGTLTNTATVTGSYDDNAANNAATDTDTLSGSADVSVSKTNGGTDSVPGTSTTYTVVASNAGPSDDTGVAVVDNPPAELACSWTSTASGGASGSAGSGSGSLAETLSLPAGASMAYTLTCDIDSAATGSLTNTAAVTGSFDGNAANDSATDTDTLSGSADVSVSKTNGGTESISGASTTYTVVAANAGPSDDTGVVVVDNPPAELSCTWTSVAAGGAAGSAGSGAGNLAETLSLPAGASMTYTLTCDIDSAATGTLTNTATVAGSYDGNAANNAATDTDTLSRSADVSVTKSNGVTTSVPGTSTTYTVVAANAGPSDDAGVAVVDTPPAELSCTWTSAAAGGATGSAGSGSGNLAETLDLPAGSSVTYTLLCAIDPAAVGSLVNTASVTGSYDDGPTNDSATDEDNLSPSADLSMSKTNGVTESIPGTPTTYTLVTSNAGPSNDIAARVTDSLPPSLDCSWTSVGDGGATGSAGSGSGSLDETLALPVGASVTYTLDCTIDDAATGTLENTAEVAGSFDPDGANDSATDADDLLGLDYGDAPDSPDGSDGTYPTLVASDGARHVADGPLLGALRDSEDDGAPSPDALGDDGAGDADEDGVALPDFLACEPAVVGVTASEAARLDAWVDWNRDGDWLDDGERIFTDEPLTAGLNSLDVAVPCDTATGEGTAGGGAFARFRLSSAGGLEPSGLALDGEVEDYLATVLAQDFGDAPDTYGTLLADDGARHGAAGGALILGELWDPEADGQPSPAADGDDGGPPRDDEDGARFDLVELVSGQQVTLPVTVSGDGTRDGFLQMWIDFDRDGTFGEGDERVATDLAVPAAAGAQQVDVPFSVPAVGTSGPTFARIRIASTAGLPPIGAADDGEVEDYRVQLIPLPTLSIAPAEVVEGDGGPTDLVFTLVRSHNLSTAAVTVSTADGTAGAPADYAALAPTAVTFAPGGAMSRDITVRVEGDALVELDETLTLTVTDPVAIAAPGAAVGGILNDDAATVTLAPAETLEGDSGQSTLAFLATLDSAVDVAVTAGATTTDRSATVADGDYKPLSDQTVTFLGGAGEVQTIAVAVNGDTAIEAHEDLLLTVTDLQASGRAVTFAGDVSTLEAVGTILNDDALLRIDDASAPEGDSGSTELVFTVSLEGVIEGGFEVDVETEETGAPDGATSGPPEPDFLAVEETLVFTGDDGETRTVAVTVFGDTTPEPTETFRVRLAPPSGDGALPELADDEGLGTIEDDDDGVPPTVASLRSNAGEITACAQLRGAAVRTLTVRVEDERSAILGGDRPADYLLVRPGADGDFETESCAGGVQGDDLAVPIRGVTATYGAMSLLATLDVGPLAPGVYRSLVCDSITDEALNPLDGDLDGLSGGDLVIPFFRSDAGNLFENGHLDGDAALCPPSLGGWIAEAEPPSLVETGLLELDDFEDAETSTSIRVTVDGGANGAGGAVLAQCVAADGGAPLLLNLQAQVRAPSGTVLLELGCRFFEETGCGGAVAAESVAVVGLTGQPTPAWLPVSHGFAAPSDAASALCEVLTGSSQGTYELFLDALTLTPGAPAEAMIFSDGFESGNTSAWR